MDTALVACVGFGRNGPPYDGREYFFEGKIWMLSTVFGLESVWPKKIVFARGDIVYTPLGLGRVTEINGVVKVGREEWATKYSRLIPIKTKELSLGQRVCMSGTIGLEEINWDDQSIRPE